MISVIPEHYNGFESKKVYDFGGSLPFAKEDYFYQYTRKYKNEKIDCFRIYSDVEKKEHSISNTYFVGVDWINKEHSHAIYIEPKLNSNSIEQTNYTQMLFSALEDSEVANHTDELFEIKWNEPTIEITQQQDLLTPLLVVQFLKVVKEIVRKGLKKSYYKVENNLYAKVKGKVLVSQTIRKNLLNNKPINTYCSYDEFGLNGLENRLLKKALVFVKRCLPTIKNIHSEKYSEAILNYITPAFEFVSEEVGLNDVKHTKTNSFYKEYEEGLRLAKLILKRFGYNISNTHQQTIKTPPFWIDMSKLFELYVLGQLKQKYGNEILYGSNEAKGKYGLPDFLLTKEGEKTIIDTKYKPIYQDNKYDIKNIRQLSGYGRDTWVLTKLGFTTPEEQNKAVVKCLIIYPDQSKKETLWDNAEDPIEGFVKFHKRAIKLPVIIKENNLNTLDIK